MSQNAYLMVQSPKKIEKIIGFDSCIRNVIMESETNGNGPGVKNVACGPPALGFRGSKNASKTMDFECLAMRPRTMGRDIELVLHAVKL